VNLVGPVVLAPAALPHRRRRGRGQLIFVSSVVGLRALPYLGGYAAAKAALDRLSEALRVELRGSGVAVTLVRPGTTDTGFSTRRLGAGHERRSTGGRGVPPERVAAAILRAARREPRVAYVSWRERLTVLVGVLAPGLTDRILAKTFTWEEEG
jgi:short-subunit dehydrogenase